jgi:hypothetical protein
MRNGSGRAPVAPGGAHSSTLQRSYILLMAIPFKGTTQTSEVFERTFTIGDISNVIQSLLTQPLAKTSEVLFERYCA